MPRPCRFSEWKSSTKKFKATALNNWNHSSWIFPTLGHYLWRPTGASGSLCRRSFEDSLSCRVYNSVQVCMWLCASALFCLFCSTHYVLSLLLQLCHYTGVVNKVAHNRSLVCWHLLPPFYCVTGMSFGFLLRHISTALYTYKCAEHEHNTL